MKQRDIDRWVNRQARMNRQATMPDINWGRIASILIVIGILLILILRST